MVHDFYKNRVQEANPEYITDSLEPIVPELQANLIRLEERIKELTTNKIKCAAFCEALKERRYFINISPSQTTNNDVIRTFVLSRYGLDITNQLLAAKKLPKIAAKKRLLKFFL